jgi:trans-2-enoyl-CoA reductase
MDKHIQKLIKPLLTRVAGEFKKRNTGKNLSEVSQFKDFKQNLDKIFGSDTKTIDQKLKGIFS